MNLMTWPNGARIDLHADGVPTMVVPRETKCERCEGDGRVWVRIQSRDWIERECPECHGRDER